MRPDGATTTEAAQATRSGLSLLLRPQKNAGEADDAALRPLIKSFAARLAETLAQRFGLRVGFAPDAGPAPDEPGPGLVARIQGEDGFASIEIGQSALYDLIEALFGGDGSSLPYREARKPSDLERAIVEGLAPAFAYALGESLAREDLALDRVLPTLERAPDMAGAALKMRLLGRESRIVLAAPRAWLGLAAAEPVQRAAAALDDLALDLKVCLREPARPLADLVGLRVGDVLALNLTASSRARVEAAGVALFDAALGQSGGRYTVRLDRRLDAAAPFFEELSR